MKAQKPILHGRDHACGGADPIPGICDLPKVAGQNYRTVQDGRYSWRPVGVNSAYEVTNWPSVHVTGAVAMAAAGASLVCQLTVTGYWIEYIQVSGGPDTVLVLDRPATAMSEVAFGGLAMVGGGTILTGDLDDVYDDITLVIEVGSDNNSFGALGTSWIEDGVATFTWVGGSSSAALPYIGSYPIVNGDVDVAAAIAPTKIQHPGGTSLFLRADATWAAAGGAHTVYLNGT